ncbi:MAG: CaiB/BaiF CoA transferase family protein [Hyphomicrobiaceae bacterium]
MMTATPLSGIRVLEFSHAVMGPTAGLIMAELGAEVIKVEPAPKGDHTRRLGGFAAGFFAALNRNKKSIAIDLKQADGKEILHRLAQNSDVIIENYAPGTMDRLGCGYQALNSVNPKLVYLALKGYLKGPYENRIALDEVVQFQSGLAYMTGPPGRPLRAGASIIDILGAAFGVNAAQAALIERQTTGKGKRVGSGLFESAAFLMSIPMAGIAATGKEPLPMPARQGAWAIYEVFETAGDGALFIGVTSDQQWCRFTDEFGLSDLASDPRLITNESRLGQRSWVIPEIQKVLVKIAQDEVEQRCLKAKVSCAPVGKPIDLFSDKHLLSNGGLLDVFISRFGDTDGKTAGLPALPFEFGTNFDRPMLHHQPPRIGEHTETLLKQAGYDHTTILDLAIRGVIRADEIEMASN